MSVSSQTLANNSGTTRGGGGKWDAETTLPRSTDLSWQQFAVDKLQLTEADDEEAEKSHSFDGGGADDDEHDIIDPRDSVQSCRTIVECEEQTVVSKIWPEWAAGAKGRPDVEDANVMSPFKSDKFFSWRSSSLSQDSLSRSRSWCGSLVVEPNASRRMWWDFLGMVCLGWDFMTIPLFVFDLHEHSVLLLSSIFVSSFWTLDIVSNFFLGFYDKGRVELCPKRIWKRYAKTWLMPDLTLVTIDWIVLYVQRTGDSSTGFSQVGPIWRISRFLRMARLLRIVKASRIFEELHDLIRSESLQTILNMVKLVYGVAMINHMIACGWYWVGSMDSQEATWVSALSSGHPGEERPDDLFVYLSALHWSLTQFTPASMEVVPRNMFERIFAIITILLAMVIFSSFVSSITAAMTHLRQIKVKQTKMQADIRKYIACNKLSSDLALQVHRFVRVHHEYKTRRVLMSDLHFVKYLPENLRIQLHSEAYEPRLATHPLFHHWSSLDDVGTAKVCYTAMSEHTLLAGEELFCYGDRCSRMYFSLVGDMNYYHHTAWGDQITDIVGSEADPKRISEIVLWMPWEHRGRLVASTSSFLLALNSAKFRGVAKGRSAMVGLARLYARGFIAELLKASDGGMDLLLDVWDEGQVLHTVALSSLQKSGLISVASVGDQTQSGLLEGMNHGFRRMLSRLII